MYFTHILTHSIFPTYILPLFILPLHTHLRPWDIREYFISVPLSVFWIFSFTSVFPLVNIIGYCHSGLIPFLNLVIPLLATIIVYSVSWIHSI